MPKFSYTVVMIVTAVTVIFLLVYATTPHKKNITGNPTLSTVPTKTATKSPVVRPLVSRPPKQITNSPKPVSTPTPTSTPSFFSFASQYVKSVVQLKCSNLINKDETVTGSGTVIDRNGYILTNKHLLLGFNAGTIYIGFKCIVYAASPDNISVTRPVYTAVAVSILKDYDAAVLKIVQDNNGNLVNPPFNFVPLQVNEIIPQIGEKVFALGYPQIGEPTFTFTSGTVTGFAVNNGQDMIEINAIINHGSSGGALLNSQYQFVGIPTALGNDGGIGYSLETRDIAKWANSVIQNTSNISSGDMVNRPPDIIANPFSPNSQ